MRRNRPKWACSSAERSMRAALKLGVRVSLDEIQADEFYAMLILEEERERPDREQLNGLTGSLAR
ncbi:MAG TPA: hypothetical protein VKV74_14000 [Bryobacteraceae bacterium]|nr:hypothetical protein [Bryobacteraceae bacterium]